MAKGGQKKDKYAAQKVHSTSNKAKNIAKAKLLGDKKAGVSLTQTDYKSKNKTPVVVVSTKKGK